MFFFTTLLMGFSAVSAEPVNNPPSALSGSAGDSSIYEVHIPPNCALGFGFKPSQQDCSSGLAMVNAVPCADDTPISTACVKKTNGDWTSYIKKTTSATETKSLLDTMVTAEGTGWGASASVSVNYMTQSAQTENSVSFYIGQNGAPYKEYYQSMNQLTLNAAAKNKLKTDWKGFIQMYGTHFVSEVTHSSTFIGNVQVTQKSSTSESALDVVAKFSVDKVFSASGSAELKQTVSEHSTSLTMEVSKWWQGQILPILDDGVENPAVALYKDYSQWVTNVNDDPDANSLPTKMVYRSWMSLEDVIATLEAPDGPFPQGVTDEVTQAFAVDLPTPNTMKQITDEYIWSKAQLNTVNMLAGYPCVKKNPDKAVIDFVRKALSNHITDIESMSMSDILNLEQNAFDDEAWFLARSNTFIDSINVMTKACQAPTLVKKMDFTYGSTECPINSGTIKQSVASDNEACKCDQKESTNINCGRDMNDYQYVCLEYTTTTDSTVATSDFKEQRWTYGELYSMTGDLNWSGGVPQWSQIIRGFFTEANKEKLGVPYAITEQKKTHNIDDLFTLMDLHTEGAEKYIKADSLVMFRTMDSEDSNMPSNVKPLLSSIEVLLFDDITNMKDSYVDEFDGDGADLNKGWKSQDFAYLDRSLPTLDYDAALTKLELVYSTFPQDNMGTNYGFPLKSVDDYRYIVGTSEEGQSPIVYDSVTLWAGYMSDALDHFDVCTADLNKGRDGRYLYLCYNVDDRERYRDHCTGDLNKGRKGAYVHVCYDYWTFGTLNPEAKTPTTCELRRSDGNRRLNMLPAPGYEAPSVGFERSQLLQRLLGNRRRPIAEDTCAGENNCYFGFPGFYSQGYPHVHASFVDGIFITFQTPRALMLAGNPRPAKVWIYYGWSNRVNNYWRNNLAYELFGRRVRMCENGATYCTWEQFITDDLARDELPNHGDFVVETSSSNSCDSGDCAHPDVEWVNTVGYTRDDVPTHFGVPDGGAAGQAFNEIQAEVERIITWWQNVWIHCGGN